jgi:hypothetical protein
MKNLSIACIDCQKAPDSVSHSWVEKSIEVVELNSKIVTFCKSSMEHWNTGLQLKMKQEVMHSQPIQIRRAVFQGDSLAITLCIALIPSTNELNNAPVDIKYTELRGK